MVRFPLRQLIAALVFTGIILSGCGEKEDKDVVLSSEGRQSMDMGTADAAPAHEEFLLNLLGEEWHKENGEVTVFEDVEKPLEWEELFYKYDDFDGDGVSELFALVGGIGNQFWFVSDQGATLLHSNMNGIDESMLSVLEVDGAKFASFLQDEGNGSLVYVYGAKDGLPFETSISQQGGPQSGHFEANTYGDLEIIYRPYGASSDGTGRSCLPYYYYVADADFKEHGALVVPLEQLFELPGAEQMIAENLPENGEIVEVLYRNNGMYHVNYRAYNETDKSIYSNQYLTLRFDGEQLQIVRSDESDYGTYEPAMIPEIATYPVL